MTILGKNEDGAETGGAHCAAQPMQAHADGRT